MVAVATAWKTCSSGTTYDDGAGNSGFYWQVPERIAGGSNGQSAVAVPPAGAPANTQTTVLRARGFGFAAGDIPTDKVPVGVEIRHTGFGADATNAIYFVALINGTAQTTADRVTPGAIVNVALASQVQSVGGSAQLFGASSLSRATVLSANFGCDIRYRSSGPSNVFTDAIDMRVWYDDPPLIQGAAVLTDADDTVAATAQAIVKAAAALADGSDTLTATAGVRVQGAALLIDLDDTMASAGQVRVQVAAALVDQDDLLATAVAARIAGAAALSDGPDTLVSEGVVLPLGYKADLVDDPDMLEASATIPMHGTADLVDAPDAFASAGQALVRADAALVDGDDTVTSAGVVRLAADAALVDGDDTVTSAGVVRIGGAAALVDATDVLAATITVSSRASAQRRVVWGGLSRRVTFG